MMILQGKGFFIWKIVDCENGNVNSIAALAREAHLSHVLIKVADRGQAYNVDPQSNFDRVPPLVDALHANGIKAYGWHYVYGDDPMAEADIAIERVQELNLDGYVIDAEAEYKQPGKAMAANQYMTRLRAGLPRTPIALSSYRYPSMHPQLPWKVFLEKCDYNMPQVYWMQSHNPGEQLRRCLTEFQALTPYRPIIPVGSAFTERLWSPTPGEIAEFMKTAQALNFTATNFWEWANCRRTLPEVWDTIKVYPWTAADTPAGSDITQQYIAALNTHDVNKVLALYNPNAVHVNATRTLQGLEAIRNWYTSFFSQILPNASFALSGFSGTGSSRHLNWTAISNAGKVLNGNDTFGLSNGKIGYHFTQFSVSQ